MSKPEYWKLHYAMCLAVCNLAVLLVVGLFLCSYLSLSFQIRSHSFCCTFIAVWNLFISVTVINIYIRCLSSVKLDRCVSWLFNNFVAWYDCAPLVYKYYINKSCKVLEFDTGTYPVQALLNINYLICNLCILQSLMIILHLNNSCRCLSASALGGLFLLENSNCTWLHPWSLQCAGTNGGRHRRKYRCWGEYW